MRNKPTNEQILEIRRSTKTDLQLMREYRIRYSALKQIKKGRPRKMYRRLGEREVGEILAAPRDTSIQLLAEKYDVVENCVRRIVFGETWTHVRAPHGYRQREPRIRRDPYASARFARLLWSSGLSSKMFTASARRMLEQMEGLDPQAALSRN